MAENSVKRAVLQTGGAYLIWGAVFPIYWKALSHLPADEVVAHRIIWSFAALLSFFFFKKYLHKAWAVLKNPRSVFILFFTALLISSNWIAYIWAIVSNQLLEASLGYYATPLATISLGAIFLKERLRRNQLIAVLLAFFGVVFLAFAYGKLPWIAIILAVTFSLYSLLRKKLLVETTTGLFIETMLILPFALLYLGCFVPQQAVWQDSLFHITLLILGGVLTILPLLLMASGLKGLSLATAGMMQYISPTLQFLTAVFIFHEPFSVNRLIAFIFIWIGLLVYTSDAIYFHRHLRKNNATNHTH